jgi:hypothetical protein
MSSTAPIKLSLCAAAIGAAVFALAGATPASAQLQGRSEADPSHAPTPDGLAKSPLVTSDLSATTPVATPAERRENHKLTAAVFGKPAAAAKAEEKVDAATQPDLSAVQPKPEWTEAKSGLGVGGKGLEIKTPF